MSEQVQSSISYGYGHDAWPVPQFSATDERTQAFLHALQRLEDYESGEGQEGQEAIFENLKKTIKVPLIDVINEYADAASAEANKNGYHSIDPDGSGSKELARDEAISTIISVFLLPDKKEKPIESVAMHGAVLNLSALQKSIFLDEWSETNKDLAAAFMSVLGVKSHDDYMRLASKDGNRWGVRQQMMDDEAYIALSNEEQEVVFDDTNDSVKKKIENAEARRVADEEMNREYNMAVETARGRIVEVLESGATFHGILSNINVVKDPETGEIVDILYRSGLSAIKYEVENNPDSDVIFSDVGVVAYAGDPDRIQIQENALTMFLRPKVAVQGSSEYGRNE